MISANRPRNPVTSGRSNGLGAGAQAVGANNGRLVFFRDPEGRIIDLMEGYFDEVES